MTFTVREIKLTAEPRESGRSNYTRRAGKVPVVVYGYQRASQALAVDAKELHLAMSHGTNALIKLSVNGSEDTVMVKAIQRHKVRGSVIHVDFIAVAMDAVLRAEVPLHIIGDEAVSQSGGIVQHQLRAVEVEALPAALPSFFTVDISGVRIGGHVTAGSLKMPAGVKLLTEADEIIVAIVAQRVAEEEPKAEGEEVAAPVAEEPK